MSAAAPIEVARDSTLVEEGNRLQALFYAVQECMRSAISSIRSHRMRSFLTMLGVIIGVASVICIVSLLQGLTQSVMNEFQGIGGNTLSIHSHTSNEDRLIGKWNKMRPADLKALDAGLAKAVQTEEWQALLKERGWVDMYQPSAEFAEFLGTERPRIEGILKQVGLVK